MEERRETNPRVNFLINIAYWAVIVAIIFLVFKLFFFPDILEENYPDDEARAQAVRTALTGR